MHRPEVKLAISRSQVRCPNHYTTESPTELNSAFCLFGWQTSTLCRQRQLGRCIYDCVGLILKTCSHIARSKLEAHAEMLPFNTSPKATHSIRRTGQLGVRGHVSWEWGTLWRRSMAESHVGLLCSSVHGQVGQIH